jgi:hypothetical protein
MSLSMSRSLCFVLCLSVSVGLFCVYNVDLFCVYDVELTLFLLLVLLVCCVCVCVCVCVFPACNLQPVYALGLSFTLVNDWRTGIRKPLSWVIAFFD